MPEHTLELNASWHGTLDGQGEFSDANLSNQFSIPKHIAGKGIGTNPEECLLASAMSCYLITLALGLKNKKITFEKIELHSTLHYTISMNPEITGITHRPTIVGADTDDTAELEKLMHSADQYCMVSKALHGNIEMTIEI